MRSTFQNDLEVFLFSRCLKSGEGSDGFECTSLSLNFGVVWVSQETSLGIKAPAEICIYSSLHGGKDGGLQSVTTE